MDEDFQGTLGLPIRRAHVVVTEYPPVDDFNGGECHNERGLVPRVPSTCADTRFYDPVVNEASQKHDWERPDCESYCCVDREPYLFVDRKQEICQNIHCRRRDCCPPNREAEPVFESRYHEFIVLKGCVFFAQVVGSAIGVFAFLPV
jgi:hypothetical protein